MSADTSPSPANSAPTLAGPVSTAAILTPPTHSQRPKFSPSHRPNKAELEACLFHAHVRAHIRRLRQSVLGQGIPSVVNPQRTAHPMARSSPRNLPTIMTRSGFAILAPTAVRPARHSIPSAPKLGPLPTPPETPVLEPEACPLLPTRRSRAAPWERTSSLCALNEFGDDPVLTPGHVFPDNFRRTPGAPISSNKSGSYFHLPPGLLVTPTAELERMPATPTPTPTSASSSTSSPGATAPVGLGITIPTNVGRRNSAPGSVAGLGIDGVDFWEEDRLERCVLTVL